MRTTILIVLLGLVLSSCRRSSDHIVTVLRSESVKPQSCDFGQRDFNTAKRADVQEQLISPELIETDPPAAVLLLDFDGHLVANTAWNYHGPINCSPANLLAAEMTEVITRVTEDFAAFNIAVTTEESLYNQCNANSRMRVIITQTWEWFGLAGGAAFMHSFTWGDNTPCFVFSVLLNYDPKKIAEAASHEMGHTLGLYHQSSYDPSCFLLSEYCSGLGIGQVAWAPIMGHGYFRNMTTWRRGSSINGCNNIQDDISLITSLLSPKPDDHSNSFAPATRINSGSQSGCINNSSDVDFFMFERISPCTVTVRPNSVNADNQGANLDIKLKIYSRDRNLLAVIDDPLLLSATTVLPVGRYYLSVESTENVNTGRYGQLGNYSVTLQ